MESNDCFMDIERFVKWTYDNSDLFSRGNNLGKFSENVKKQWRRYEKLPLNTLKEINDNYLRGYDRFDCIKISELIFCISIAKDHNRGNVIEYGSITSTGKKVMLLFLLGRQIDSDNLDEAIFTVYENKDDALYNYLKGNGDVKTFYYFPGRTVSYKQLCELGNAFKNNITASGVEGGLEDLVDIGLVSCVDENEKLYKLDFNECKAFLEHNKKDFEGIP